MPPSNSVGSVHDDNDQATVDTNTILQKPSTTPDGKSVEALIQRRLEIDRQLQALENETVDAGSTSGGSIENNLRLPAATSSESSQAYNRSTNTTMPAPQSPEYQYPGGLPTTDESVEHSYPPVQAPMHPINGMFAHPVAPRRLSSTLSVSSVNSGSNHGPSIKPHAAPASYPFTNPYDPQFLAAAVYGLSSPATLATPAGHHEFTAATQQTQQPQKPKEPEKANDDDNKNASMLWKLLSDKEEELKEVRQTLRETQQKFQEQSLLATKLQTTLDQVQEAFEKERLLIKLQAEKEAQEAMFQKQLLWMEKNAITKQQVEDSAKEDAKAPSSEPAETVAAVAMTPNGKSAKSPTKTSPDKQRMAKEANNAYNGIKTNPSEENDKLLAIAKSSSNGIQLYPSIDESLSGGNQNA
eukprot:CAMPEP_0116157228 /NCGR_PEP_ID=MMETSP0329-20121206/23235_1 /TAXON_ID=697910 /ORGANISM="Pseudo-nitzschia arenysensis, Strain B593" /LENGTH=411 /DNA_ID=CAMNT_0003654327 /DNA_START=21 /DNA_END=1252 /DNA_ORIENTATION=-